MAEPLLLGVQTGCEAAFIVAPGSNQAFNAAGMISPAAERTVPPICRESAQHGL